MPRPARPPLPTALMVHLHVGKDLRLVGRLARLNDNYVEFTFFDEYRRAYPRPVLGQFFEDDLTVRHRSRMRLVPYFSNLLPEGALRELIAVQRSFNPEHEFALLLALGEDLPGAVVVTPAEDEALLDAGAEPEQDPGDYAPPAAHTSAGGPLLKFSLAGVQLKFSMLEGDRGLTLPTKGRDGDWIVKTPDERRGVVNGRTVLFTHVPQNEFAMMTWARAAGIVVPETRLYPLEQVAALPPGLLVNSDEPAYAIRRFDRGPLGRVHMEDFAQVFNRYAHQKYQGASYETLAVAVLAIAGAEALQEFLRRLVFIVAIGNGDAHLKNWSLRYPDGLHGELAPAYDLVSTIQYIEPDGLALNLAGSKRWQDVSMASFLRLREIIARRLPRQVPEEALVVATVREAVARIYEAWGRLRGELPIPESFKHRLEVHRAAVPLLR